jgi:DNA-binding winged helix-turn-helix (wHTH) protein
MLFTSRSVIFDEFRFIVPTRELLRIGNDGLSTPILLGSRAAEILYLLLQRHGEVVSKNAIMDAAWPYMAIQESNLTVQISALRRALDDGRNGASCIQTVPGRGYRLLRASWKKAARSRIDPSLVRRYRIGLIRWPTLTFHRRNPCRQPHGWPISAAEASEKRASMWVLSDSFAQP